MVSLSTSLTSSCSMFTSIRREKPSNRWVMERQRSTERRMASTSPRKRSRSGKSLASSMRSEARPAFSLMIASGLLISCATPAARRPMEDSFWVCSICTKAAMRRSSLARMRRTSRSVRPKATDRISATLVTNSSIRSLRRVVHGLKMSARGFTAISTKSACWK
ncbi:hypothetical protein DSECCO2_639370 [anaerobic digester metagenome]